MSPPLGNELRLLLTGQGLSLFGDKMQDLALPLWILAVTGSSTQLGLAFTISVAPIIILSPWAGWAVDRWDRRRILIASELCSAAVIGGLLFAVHHRSIAGVFVAIVATKIFNSASLPAVQAIIKSAADAHTAGRAAATSSAISGVATTLAPLLGGLLYQVAGLAPLLVANLLSFVASAACVIRLRSQPGDRSLGRPVTANLRAVRTLASHPQMRRVAGAEAAYFLFAGALGVIGMLVVERSLGDAAAGVFVSGQGIGWLAGSLIVRRYAGHAFPLIVVAAAICGPVAVLMVGMLDTSVPMAGVMGVAEGGANALVVVAAMLLYQAGTPSTEIGRVFALRRMVVNSCLSLAFAIWPILLIQIGQSGTLLLAGWSTTAVMLLVLSAHRRHRVVDAQPASIPHLLREEAG